MKKILNKILLAGICSVFFTTACVEKFAVGDAFLEKAPGVDVNIDTVFSSAEYSQAQSIPVTSFGVLTARFTAHILLET